MTLHDEISRWPTRLRVDASGDAAMGELNALVEFVAAATRAGGMRRVLVDLTRVREHLKFTDHYALCELVARGLAHLQRLASSCRRSAAPAPARRSPMRRERCCACSSTRRRP